MALKINNKSLSRGTSKRVHTNKRSYTRKTTLDISSSSRTRTKLKIGKRSKSDNKFISFVVKFIAVACIVVGLIECFNYSKNYLYANEKFFIDSIEIKGCNNVTQSEIMKILPFQVGESLLQIDLGEAEKELGNYKTELKNISMHRKWLDNKVIVALKERVPEVFINVEDKKFGLDFDNKPFNLRGNMSNMKVPYLLFDDNRQRQILLSFFQQVKKQIKDLIPNITEIKFGEVDDIVLTLNNKTNIYWGAPKEVNIEEKCYKLQKVLDDLSKKKIDIESIDLSFLDNNKDMILVKKFVNKENKVNV